MGLSLMCVLDMEVHDGSARLRVFLSATSARLSNTSRTPQMLSGPCSGSSGAKAALYQERSRSGSVLPTRMNSEGCRCHVQLL